MEKKGKIYKVVDKAYTEMYIGSTTQLLSKRMASHRSKYNSYLNKEYHYNSIYDLFDNYGVENCKIELIEEINFINKEELLKKEGEHIMNNNCINKQIAGRTKKQYDEDHKNIKKQYDENYREDNKEKIKQYMKEYRKNKKII